MDTSESIIKHLESKNYRFCRTNNVCFPHSDGFWQKKFTDETGIKYFIEFVYYSAKNGAHFAFMGHLSINGDNESIFHQTYEQHHLNTIEKIQQAELNAEKFWQNFGCYYEKFVD